jgi:hypothetical protein
MGELRAASLFSCTPKLHASKYQTGNDSHCCGKGVKADIDEIKVAVGEEELDDFVEEAYEGGDCKSGPGW